MKLTSFSLTDIGRVRKNNQDSCYSNDALKLYLVADGLGGHAAGDVASRMAKDWVVHLFSSTKHSFDPASYLTQAIQEANHKIYDKASDSLELKGMGTTFTGLYFSYDTAYIAHVGDSRAYVIYEKMIWQLSQDHTVISQQFMEKAHVPVKNALTRSVGFDAEVEVDLYTKKANKGEVYVLCTDGLHGFVAPQEIVNIVNQSSYEKAALEKATQDLVKLANERGGDDNITVVLTRVER